MAAASTATPTVTLSRFTDAGYRVVGTLAIGASTLEYRTGGLILNFLQSNIKASRIPLSVQVKGIAGYDYSYVTGTDASDGKLVIRAQKASASDHDALTELADVTAIPAGVSGDTITFEALWRGME
jgi:hypothetical protein